MSYADVNGLSLYYEVHGTAEPTAARPALILLHGGLGGADMFAPILPALAARRQVIAVDLQAHAHTADVDRPLRLETCADDVAALIEHLGLGQADLMGYSFGAGVALRTAIQHPHAVRRLVCTSFPVRHEGWLPDEGLNLHVSGIRAVCKPGLRRRWVEASLLATHVVVYLVALFTVLSPGMALLFLAVHQALWGIYMGSIFAPNHKGMPTLTGQPELDFLRKQVLTSRNVRGGGVTDVALGGLNYQIEHHLFPSMPSRHLRLAQPIVQEYCAELDIPYLETSLIESYRQALTHLHEAGAPLRNRS